MSIIGHNTTLTFGGKPIPLAGRRSAQGLRELLEGQASGLLVCSPEHLAEIARAALAEINQLRADRAVLNRLFADFRAEQPALDLAHRQGAYEEREAIATWLETRTEDMHISRLVAGIRSRGPVVPFLPDEERARKLEAALARALAEIEEHQGRANTFTDHHTPHSFLRECEVLLEGKG